MTTSPTTLRPSSETSKQKTTEANSSVFISILAQSFNGDKSQQGSFDNTVGNFLAHAFIHMDSTDRALTVEFLNKVPNIAKIFGYYLQLEITNIDESREYITRILRESRYHKLAEQVPQEISDDVRKEITNLKEGNESVKRGMAECTHDMYRDSFK